MIALENWMHTLTAGNVQEFVGYVEVAKSLKANFYFFIMGTRFK
jgi:hypothetical protein